MAEVLDVRVDKSFRVSMVNRPAEVAELVAELEAIAADLGWQPGDQIRNYESNSVYFGASAGGRLVGGLQLVVANGRDSLPSQNVWPEIDMSARTDVAHALILALEREYRGTPGLFVGLTVEMWRYCVLSGVREIWHEATPPTLRLYRRIGWPLEVVGDLRPHWGEDLCYLCRMGTAEVAGIMAAKAIRSQSHKEMLSMMTRPAEARPVAAIAGL